MTEKELEAQGTLSYKKTLLVGFGFFGIGIVWTVFNQFLPILLQAGHPDFNAGDGVIGFALAPAAALFIMTWDNILNVFLQPWAGARSDQTWNKFGRRKGWIMLGVPIAAISFAYIPLAPTVFLVATFILITNLGMAIFRSPTAAWLGDLFSPEHRSQANGIINLMAGIGGLLAFFVGGILFDSFGQHAPFWFGSIVLIAAALVVVFCVKEPRAIASRDPNKNPSVLGVAANLKQVMRNPDRRGLIILISIFLWFIAFNALETSLSSFAVSELGMEIGQASILSASFTVTFILFSPVAGFIGFRNGRQKTIKTGLILLSLITGVAYFVIQNTATYVFILVLAGICWAMINVNSLPLVFDFGDKRIIGTLTGLYYFSSQLASIAGPNLSAQFIQIAGNDFRVMWPFSAIFLWLAWVAIQFIRESEAEY